MAGVVDAIRDWATTLAYWEQAALERVVSGRPFSDDDYDYLLKLFLEDAGLKPKRPGERPTLVFPAKTTETLNTSSLRLERLFNIRDVNALPSGQEIRFGSQVTLVYGCNSAGKTGYARPLGCAAFARGEREVLADARKQNAQGIPSADIEITQSGLKTTVSWRNGSRCPELAGVYVFDGASASVHLNRANALSFSPAGLSLLTSLAEVTDEARRRLRKIIDEKRTPHSFGALFPGESAVSREIAKLSASTDVAALKRLATVSADEEKKTEELNTQITTLKSQNTAARISILKQEQGDLQALLNRIEQTARDIGLSAEQEVEMLVASLQARREEADRVGTDQFKFERFTQVGSDVWREFVVAAKALADAEAQRGSAYPGQGDPCLLCRQTLSPEAVELIHRLWSFMTSDAPKRLEEAEQATRKRESQFRRVELGYFGADSPGRRILQAEAPEFVADMEAFLGKCSTRRTEFESSLTSGSLSQFTPISLPDLAPLRAAIQRRTNQIAELEKGNHKQKLDTLLQALRELEHRRMLRDQWQEIEAWVEDQTWAARAQNNLGSTHHITAKYNELFEAVVTNQYRQTFQDNLNRLKRNIKVSIETRGQKGTTVRQLVLSPEAFAQKFPVEKTLSDGEKRTVALVDFLTEASLDPSCAALVLDDPVSSMDLDSKRRIAEILIELSAKRQVIVFTHDLVFLHALKACANRAKIDVTSHWIRIEGDQPGYVYLDNSPTCEADYKSAEKARKYYREAKDAAPEKQEDLLKHGFGALRSSYEAFVIYGLFNEVVRRFEERVSFDRLKDVRVDQDIVDEVVGKMGVLSRYIEAHLHSDNYAGEKPTPELLLQEIEAFDALRKKQAERKKASTVSGAEPAPTAKVTILAVNNKESSPMPEQPGSAAIN
jgi:hypothetical protein